MDGLGEVLSTTIRQVIPSHRGNNYVLQAQSLCSFSNTLRLIYIEGCWLTMRHRAKSTIASANIPQYHESSYSSAKTLSLIWAMRTFAHSMEL
jgi:hypothetical protein